MNTGQTVFGQLMEIIPRYQFQICVDRYQGNRYVKDFSCWDQFLCLAFAQLTERSSLRDIETCLRAQQSKLYHMGLRGRVSRGLAQTPFSGVCDVPKGQVRSGGSIQPVHTQHGCVVQEIISPA